MIATIAKIARPDSVRAHPFPGTLHLPVPTTGLFLAATVFAVAVGFHTSLLSLLSLAGANTPVAFVAFVPAIALYVGHVSLLGRGVPATRDYFIDSLVFSIFAVITCIAVFILPIRMSWDYWRVRPDLLALPVFAAAVITLLLGTRACQRLFPAIACLWLAWPIPYFAVIGSGNDIFLHFTTSMVNVLLHILPVALPPVAVDGTVYRVATPTGMAALVIGSSCAGLNGFLGYLVIGTPVPLSMAGALWRKALWVLCGMLLTMVANAIRVLLILAVAHVSGVQMALQVIHPVLGAILFGVVFLAMLNAQSLFGVRARARYANASATPVNTRTARNCSD